MIPIVEKEFVLTPEEEGFVTYVMTPHCPYHIQDAHPEESDIKVWTHILMVRDETNAPVQGVINSHLFAPALNLFSRFCAENDIHPKAILRACLNATGPSKDKHGVIHTDHDGFTHYNFIMYLNDVGGNTYIFNDANEVIYEVEAKKNKVVIFEGAPHAQGFCSGNDYRFVLVFTFTI